MFQQTARASRNTWPGAERGQALVEYSLLLTLVFLVALGGLMLFGGSTGALYEVVKKVADAMAAALS